MDTPDPDPYSQFITLIISAISTDFSFSTLLSFFVLLVLLVISALVSGSETALFSLQPSDINALESSNDPLEKLVLHIREKPKTLLATILIANNLVNVAIVILSTFITSHFFDFSHNPMLAFVIQVVVVTSLILLLGEIIPKVVANKYPRRLAVAMARPLQIMITMFRPLSRLLVSSTTFLDKRLVRKTHNISMSELSAAIDITSDESTPPEEKKMLKGIATFSEKEVRNIMKSRVNVTAIDGSMSFEAVLEVVINSGYSRIPVYEGGFDKVLGILYIKDLIPFLEQKQLDWLPLIRPAFFVPENKKINDLLQEFRQKKIHMAIVVDEYGGTSGLLTLEDIIEEIVGEISDEFDKEPESSFYEKISEDQWLFEARTSLLDFSRVLNLDDHYFEDVQGDSDTLAGLILELEGRIPEIGSRVPCKQFVFEVSDADERRIKQIKVRHDAANED